MNEFIKSFSNRETALFVWGFAILGVIMLKKDIRKVFIGVLKAFFVKKIFLVFASFILYISLWIFILFKIGFWDKSLLKDTILWTFGFASLTIINVNKVKSKAYFKEIFIDSIKWAVVIEFIVSFYTFSLRTELLILPIVTFAAIMQVFSKREEEYKQVNTLMTKFLLMFSIIIFVYTLYKTVTLWSALMTTDNFKSFLLPIFMTILFMPFIYALALVIEYEQLFIRLDFLTKDKEQAKKIKYQILQIASFDLDKLGNISKNIAKQLLIDKDNSFENIKRISQKVSLHR